MATRYKSRIDVTVARRAMEAGVGKGLRDAVEHLLTEANKRVPHDDGTLERTGTASVDGDRGAVSYDTPYAVRQHEDMDLAHDGKGEAKWLETTLGREAGTVAAILATAMRNEVK